MTSALIRIVFVAACAGSSAPAAAQSLAAAQSPFPGGVQLSPGQWVPCSHRLAIEAGRGCVASSPGSTQPAPSAPGSVDAGCGPLPDPYREPERVIAWNACRTRTPEPNAVPTFLLGHVYSFGYNEPRARIVSLGTDDDGTQIVTAKWLDGGALEAFRTPPTRGGETVWRWVEGPR